MSPETLLLYATTIFAVSIVPGPSMALAFHVGLRGNWHHAVAATLGNVVASLLQALVAFLILRAVLEISPAMFRAMTVLGAAFLLYVSVSLFRQARSMALDQAEARPRGGSATGVFLTGFLVAFVNPKAILFFVALFPKFVGQAEGLAGLALLFVPIGLIALVCFAVYILLGQSAQRLVSGPAIVLVVRAMAMLMGLAALLILAEALHAPA